jgi:hypothetical protein
LFEINLVDQLLAIIRGLAWYARGTAGRDNRAVSERQSGDYINPIPPDRVRQIILP